MRPYSPGGALIAFATAPKSSETLIPSAHRLRRGLPGYLILFAPHAFVSQRQDQPRTSLSPSAFPWVSTHFTAPPKVPGTPTGLKNDGLPSNSSVEPRAFTKAPPIPPTHALSPIIPNNACLLRITAAAGTELAEASFGVGQNFLTPDSSLRREAPSSYTRRRSVRLSPIAEYSLLQPPVGVRAVSQSRCGGPRSHARYPSQPW